MAREIIINASQQDPDVFRDGGSKGSFGELSSYSGDYNEFSYEECKR